MAASSQHTVSWPVGSESERYRRIEKLSLMGSGSSDPALELCDKIKSSDSIAAEFFDDAMAVIWLSRQDLSEKINLSTEAGLYTFLYWYCFVYPKEIDRETNADAVAQALAERIVMESPWPRLPITALMLAAYHWDGLGDRYPLETDADLDYFLAAFFMELVGRHGLRRFVTTTQRTELRRILSTGQDTAFGLTLPMIWAWRLQPELRKRIDPAKASDRRALWNWFLDEGAVHTRTDYTLPPEFAEWQTSLPILDDGTLEPPNHTATAMPPDTIRSMLLDLYAQGQPSSCLSRSALKAAFLPANQDLPPSSNHATVPGTLLSPGIAVRFGTGGSGLPLTCGSGWSEPESRWIWTIKPIAILSFSLPPDTTGPLEMGLLLDGINADLAQRIKQKLTIFFNDMPLVHLRLAEHDPDKELVFPLPLYRTAGQNYLQLACAPLACPADWPGYHDHRRLGIKLWRLWVA